MSTTRCVSHRLLATPLFQNVTVPDSLEERVALSYDRAVAIARCYEVSLEDVLKLQDKFWDLHRDPISAIDGAAATLLSIHYNLFVGTIAPFVKENKALRPIIGAALPFEINGQFLLTEVAHGLDVTHMETTATQLMDGTFELHSPAPGAAKFMPPTSPVRGIPKFAVVFARLVVKGEFRGIRGFVVQLTDKNGMCRGVTSKLLPQRSGSKAVDHAITSFERVRLPSWTLLGSTDMTTDVRGDLQRRLWRVGIGAIALSFFSIPLISVSALIAGTYSLRRHVISAKEIPLPIISFRTQQLPILHAIAQAHVLRALSQAIIPIVRNPKVDPKVLHGIGTAVKAVMNQHCQSSLYALSERLGAQGLYGYNQIITSQAEMRGVCIAEGDILTLSIRLASELLQGKYELPQVQLPNTLLAQHELGLVAEARDILHNLVKEHRGQQFNELILPRCRMIVESIGQRMAYEAAAKAGVHPALLKLYECHVAGLDIGWYIENGLLTRKSLAAAEAAASNDALVDLQQLLEDVARKDYAVAPIMTDESWAEFVDTLPTFNLPQEREIFTSARL